MEIDDDSGFEELEAIAEVEPEGAEAGETESIEESIAIAFEQVDAKAAEKTAAEPEDRNAITEAAKTLASSKKKGPKRTVEAEALDVGAKGKAKEEHIAPSDDWDLKIKEEFNGLPSAAIKQRTLDFYNGMKANATKALQELSREKTRHSEVNEIVDYYLPRWGMEGRSAGQVARELFAAQEVILRDPEFAIATLIKKNNANYDKINAYLEGHSPAATPAANVFQAAPQNQGLTREEIIATYRELREQEQQQGTISVAQAEVRALKHQTSADGRTYLYPELHSEDDIERLKPLVDNIRKTQPGISWSDATIRAIQADRYALGRIQSSPSPGITRLPKQQEIQRARQASVSIRGRGNPATPSLSVAEPGESIEDSLRAVWQGNNGIY